MARSPLYSALTLVALTCSWGLGCSPVSGDPIRIAFAGPTSGPSAEDGLSAVRAIELIFDQANEQGGIRGRPLALVVYDDRNDVDRARRNAEAVADDTATLAVIGHNTSTNSIEAGKIYAARGLPAISAAATSIGVTADNPWYFRVIYNDRDQGRFITAYLRKILEVKSFGLIHETRTYGSYLASVMKSTAPQVGLTLSERWSFDPGDPGVGPRLAAIARQAVDAKPEVLVLAMQPEAGVPLVKDLRDRGFDGLMVVTDALASQAFAEGFGAHPAERARRGFYTDGIYASTPFLFDVGGPLAADFGRAYFGRTGHPPDWYAAFAADAATVLVEALRRADLSSGSDALERNRRALRDELASIGELGAVEGITGPIWFDAVGDASKPVPMGRFLNGDILSASAELHLLPGVRDLDDLGTTRDPRRAVELDDQVLYRTDVAQVGVRSRHFGELDFEQGTFELDFDLWFRHRGDPGIEQIVFTNAVEPVELRLVDDVVERGLRYRLYRGRGLFRADLLPAPYDGHTLALSIRHRERTREELILAVDPIGMNLGRRSTRANRGETARRLLGADSEWAVDDVFFFESAVNEHALGHPSYLGGDQPVRNFSQLTIGITLRPQSMSLARLIPARQRGAALGLALAGSVLLLFVGRSRLRAPRFVLQALLLLLALAAAEPLVASWLGGQATPASVARMSRVFEILWWLAPALLLNVAIRRFLWWPAEERTGNPIPSLLKVTIAFMVMLLAIFGIIAFVYDYRLTGLLATSGVLAMIIGLAVQLNITNIFAGVALNLERPFRVGDWIMIHGRTPDPDQGVIGIVVDINWRTTRLRTADDTEILIPNGVISEKTITNFMHPGELSRFELTFTVDHHVPPEKVIPVIQQALDHVSGPDQKGPVADPPPKVRISHVTDQGVEYVVRYRIVPRNVSPLQARHTINQSVLRHLNEAGIELAYPRRIIEDRSRPT